MTDNAQPTTEAGRRAIEGFIVADYEDGPLYEDGQRGLILAIEAEARAESAAKVRAAIKAARIDAMGRHSPSEMQWFVHPALDAVERALDADAPAETPLEVEHADGRQWTVTGYSQDLRVAADPEPRSAEHRCGRCGVALSGWDGLRWTPCEPRSPEHKPVWVDDVPTGWCVCGAPWPHAAPEPRSAEPEGLDAETLAWEMHLTQRWCDGTESVTWRTDTVDEERRIAVPWHREDAEALLARLRGEQR